MSTSLDPQSLFGQQLTSLRKLGWWVMTYHHDYGWSKEALEVLSHPGWRFTIRINTVDVEDQPVERVLKRPWNWLRRVERYMKTFRSYQSQYGIEFYAKYAKAEWQPGPSLHRVRRYEYPGGATHEDIGWRFLDPDIQHKDDYFFAYDFFRYDFSLAADEAIQLKLGGAYPMGPNVFPREWPTTASGDHSLPAYRT